MRDERRRKWRRDGDVNRLIWTRISALAVLWGFLKMTPGDGITQQFMQSSRAGHSTESMGGGKGASPGEKWDSDLRNSAGKETENVLVAGCLATTSFAWYCYSEWQMTGQKTCYLFLYPPSSSPILLALAGCIYDKANWQLNLIEFSRQWLWRHFLHSVWVI